MALEVAGLFMAVVGLIGALLFGFLAAMTIARRNENQPHGQVLYTISDSGLSLRTDSRHESFLWADVSGVQKNDRYIWIDARDNVTRFIPRSSCNSDGEFLSIWDSITNGAKARVR